MDENIPNEKIPRPIRKRNPVVIMGVLCVLALGMFSFAYANASFFVMLCQKVGLLSPPGGGTLRGDAPGGPLGREIDIYFTASVSDKLPIDFSVKESFQETHIGQERRNDYTISNLSNETIYIRPIHDVSPIMKNLDEALVLTKCFCFNEQKLEPRQSYTFPVQYTFTDKTLKTADVISMRYTLFRSTKEQYEASIKAAAAAEKVSAPAAK